MEEEKEELFSEFEGVHLPYRRSLLPWWIWGILGVYTGLSLLSLVSNIWSLINGYQFVFEMFHINILIPFPYYPLVSVAIFVAITLSFILLVLEKRKAALIALICFSVLLVFCAVLLVAGFIKGYFYVRIEMLVCIDLIFRMKDIRTTWENKAIPHRKTEE